MAVVIRPVGLEMASRYREVPMSFQVRSVWVPRPTGDPGILLHETPCPTPYTKDYDADAEEEDHPGNWRSRWDTSHWGMRAAFDGGRLVGWSVVATRTPGLHMLEGREDLAVLWDLRVHPDLRRRGVGTRLFDGAVLAARERGCRRLKIETQNTNVVACRLYAARGCRLGGIVPGAHAYPPHLHHETMLLWYLDL